MQFHRSAWLQWTSGRMVFVLCSPVALSGVIVAIACSFKIKRHLIVNL